MEKLLCQTEIFNLRRRKKLNFDKNSDLNATFAPAYRELFDNIRPSEQLLTATRSLYTARPRQTLAFPRRVWPAAAASLCAACLLLTIGLQFWPQPIVRTASQPPEQSVARSVMQDETATERSAYNTEQSIMPLSDNTVAHNTPEICSYPLRKQNDQALKPFIRPTEFIHCSKPANIWQIMPHWAARALSWLTLW